MKNLLKNQESNPDILYSELVILEFTCWIKGEGVYESSKSELYTYDLKKKTSAGWPTGRQGIWTEQVWEQVWEQDPAGAASSTPERAASPTYGDGSIVVLTAEASG